MDLDDILAAVAPPRGRGRLAKTCMHSYERELTGADMTLLADVAVGQLQVATPPVKRLMHKHHTLARLIASGTGAAEISLITGYCISRISVLKSMPIVAELIEYYKGQKDEIFLDVHQRLASLGLDVVEELHQRLESNPEDLTSGQLVDIAKLSLDRAGYGPVSTQKVQGAVALLRPEDLDRLKQEIRDRQNATLRQIGSSDSSGPEIGADYTVQSVEDTAAQADGQPGEGN